MRTITKYLAFDDNEFNNEKDCHDYEQFIWDNLMRFIRNYELCDGKGRPLSIPPMAEIEDLLPEFEAAANACEEINIHEEMEPTDPAYCWVYNYCGFYFPREKGRWRYNWHNHDWVKIG